MKKILIVVAHSDDETIGCGATIARHHSKGDKVYCVSMTDGVSSRSSIKKNRKEINFRLECANKASKILGFKWLNDMCGDFPDNAMDKIELIKIVKLIEKVKKIIKPDIIYTHHPYDLNIDHQKVAEAVFVAFRPLKNENWQKILTFEVPSSTDYSFHKNDKIFQPNFFLNIEKFWQVKKKALECYKKEINKFPSSRSIKGIEILAKLRGTQNGIKMAEAFQLIKEIER